LIYYSGITILEKVRAEIGDLYPLIPDPKFKGAKPLRQADMWQSSKDEVPPGYLVPVAYLWTRTVRCKNPTCGATVPLVKQTWLCVKKDLYVALRDRARITSHSGAELQQTWPSRRLGREVQESA